jgi:hypothetical protein
MAVTVALAGGRIEPDLPQWDPEERKALIEGGWVPGALLLTDDPLPESETPLPEPEPLHLQQPTDEEVANDALPQELLPETYVSDYFADCPAEFLVDPQALLATEDARNLLAFLNSHSRESSIDLFVYLFTTDQEIPSDVRFEEMVERFFSEGKPSCVVFYYMGAPQRSALFLSPVLTEKISAPEQRRSLQSSVMQAFNHTGHAEQLEAFCVQMAIRMYWMETMMNGGVVSAFADLTDLMTGSTVKKPAVSTPGWLVVTASRWGGHAALAAAALTLSAGLAIWLRIRARYRFPEFEVEPRLAGPHAAGVGAVISFTSAAVPPASQRDQMPDYLRRAN